MTGIFFFFRKYYLMLEYPFLHLWQGDILLLLQMEGIFEGCGIKSHYYEKLSYWGLELSVQNLTSQLRPLKNIFFQVSVL